MTPQKSQKQVCIQNFNINRVLRWRLILEEYGTDIKYIMNTINLVTDTLSWLPNNVNKETTHESMYKIKTMSENYDIDELPEVKFRLFFKVTNRQQQEDPFLLEKLKCKKYQLGCFCGGRDTI